MKIDLINLIIKASELDECSVAKAEDFNLYYPYAIDIEDESVFYASKEERDSDYNELRLLEEVLIANLLFV